jgi:predicted transcriptional regulator of viral defense system
MLLIRELLEAEGGGRVFTAEDGVAAGAELGLSAEHVYKLLSQMVERGLLDRPRGGLYVMRPPFGGLLPVRPVAVAVHAVAPAAASGDSALVHWGLLSQAPLHEEVVSTPARIQWRHGVEADGADRMWKVGGATIRYRHVPEREMFGIVSVRLDAETVVPMFDRERALLELEARPDGQGSRWAAELVRQHSDVIDRARLQGYRSRLAATRPSVQTPRHRRRRTPSAAAT